MPDLPNRRAHEERFAYGLAQELTRQRRALVAYGVENLPERPAVEWERDKEELAAILLMMLRDPWFTAHYGLAGEVGIALFPDDLEGRFQKWAKDYAVENAGLMVDNTREIAVEAAALLLVVNAAGKPVEIFPSIGGAPPIEVKPSPREPLPFPQANLFDVADTKRVVRTSISMVTDATSAGEQAVADEFAEKEAKRVAREEAAGGGGDVIDGKAIEPAKTLVAYWHTERDGKVCPICRPLHGLPEKDWRDKFPDGPKAHVACRCYLDWRIE